MKKNKGSGAKHKLYTISCGGASEWPNERQGSVRVKVEFHLVAGQRSCVCHNEKCRKAQKQGDKAMHFCFVSQENRLLGWGQKSGGLSFGNHEVKAILKAVLETKSFYWLGVGGGETTTTFCLPCGNARQAHLLCPGQQRKEGRKSFFLRVEVRKIHKPKKEIILCSFITTVFFCCCLWRSKHKSNRTRLQIDSREEREFLKQNANRKPGCRVSWKREIPLQIGNKKDSFSKSYMCASCSLVAF